MGRCVSGVRANRPPGLSGRVDTVICSSSGAAATCGGRMRSGGVIDVGMVGIVRK
jgi:hypothetical protein